MEDAPSLTVDSSRRKIFGEGGQRRLIPLEVAFGDDRCAHGVHVRATHARAQVIDGYSVGGVALACADKIKTVWQQVSVQMSS